MIETTPLYNGEIICEFNAVRHTYVIVNKRRRFKVPGVTRITSVLDKSGPLVNWAINNTLDVCRGAIAPGCEYAESYLEAVWGAAKKVSGNLKAEAADRGKQLHALIEHGIGEGAVEPSNESVLSVVDWLRSKKLRVLCNEVKIYSRRHRYSGTLDCLANDQEELYLLDWKTSKSIYPEFRLQTAAYVAAYEEEFPDKKIAGRYLVRIAEDGSVDPHFFPRATLRKDLKAFLGAKALFDRVQQIEKENRKSLKTNDK